MEVMPDFENGFHGFHHTVDSALENLAALGISAERVTLRMDGAGLPSRWIARQQPPPGMPLGPGAKISLVVAGLGFFQALPVGMWDMGGETEPGTREIVELLDDPLQKAGHWIRGGARLFEVRPGNPGACARWIALFGVNPDEWPAAVWYTLAILLPSLQDLAGKEHGIRFALQALLGLPLKEVRRRPSFRRMRDEDFTLLARRSSRLGVDCIVGDRVEDLAQLTFVIGPVSLAGYYEFQQPANAQLLNRVLDLCAPFWRKCALSWTVLDERGSPRLGLEAENARLGINSHLGYDPRPRT